MLTARFLLSKGIKPRLTHRTLFVSSMLLSVSKTTLPENALLQRYCNSENYTDCYTSVMRGEILHSEFIYAFYTTWLFKIERALLKRFVAKPSTDQQALKLAQGARDDFSAWIVESRCDNQLLMSDFHGRTRSWFMSERCYVEDKYCSRLYFGSAVVSPKNKGAANISHRLVLNGLLCFHKLYSRSLLNCAVHRLNNSAKI